MSSSKLLLLGEQDNCLSVIQTIEPNETFFVENSSIIAKETIPIGFKIARENFSVGNKIIKWQMSIGSATQIIKRGEVIHTNNMKSDYIPTLLREKQESYFKTHS